MHIRTTFTFAAATLGLGALSSAVAGPTGGVVVNGQGSISTPSANTTVVDQTSQNLNLNWNTFNVAANENVQFHQPSSSAVAFNRILDQNPSQVFGRIDANGKVVLVNPNGLLIGRTAQLNVNSLVVSSLDAIDFDAASGRYRFSTNRNNPGAVINEGSITAGPGGSVTLLGGQVSNTGSIVADYGTVNLAAGRTATLDLAGDGMLRLEVGNDLLTNQSGAASAVENSGSIQANGGRVLLTANAVRDVFTNLVNNSGVVRANRIDDTGGTITLLGPEGAVISSGTLDASARDGSRTGGSVSMLGERVGLLGSAVVDVSGANSGGTALIGGDYQGHNPDVLNAKRTFVGTNVTINADAGANGDGGRVIAWSDDFTRFDGRISARGGLFSGHGGFAEVSGKQTLSFTGYADLRAPHGAMGSLLLDPDSIQIDNDAGGVPTALSDDGIWEYTADTPGLVHLGVNALKTQLNAGNVELQSSSTILQTQALDTTGNTNVGSLTLRANTGITLTDMTLKSGSSLTATAGGLLALNGALQITGPSLDLTGNAITMGNGSSINHTGGLTTMQAAGNINFNGTGSVTGALAATSSFGSITVNANYTLDGNGAPVALTAQNGIIDVAGTVQTTSFGDISLDGASITTDSGSTIQAASGDIHLRARMSDVQIGGDTKNSGSLFVNADVGKITMSSTGKLEGGTGTFDQVQLTAQGDVQVAAISGKSATISSGGNITDDGAATTVDVDSLDLTAGTDAGSSITPLSTTAGSLTAQVEQNAYIRDSRSGSPVTLQSVVAGHNGTSGDLNLTTTSAGIIVKAASAHGTAKLDSADMILNFVPGTGVQASTVDLTAVNAIGANGNPLVTAAGTIKAQTTFGDIYLHDTGTGSGVTLDTIAITNASNKTADLTADSAMTVKSVVANASNAAVNLTAPSIADDGFHFAGSTINTETLTLTTTIGGIGSATGAGALDTDVSTLNTTAAGDVFIHEVSGVTLDNVQANGRNVTIDNGFGNITINNIGSTTPGNNPVASANITAAGSILDDINHVGSINAGTVSLTANGGGVGVFGQEIALTGPGTVALTAKGTGGGVFFTSDKALSLENVTATGVGSDVMITTSANSNITVKTVAAGRQAALMAAGSINDDNDPAAPGTITRITAPTVTLVAKSVGAATAKGEIDTDADTLDVMTSGGTGGVFIGELNGLTRAHIDAVGSAANVNLTAAAGDIVVEMARGRAVTLTASAGKILDDGVHNNATNVIDGTTSVDLEAQGDIGDDGTGTGSVDVGGSTVTAHAGNGGAGNVFLHAANGVTLADVSAAGAAGKVIIAGDGSIAVDSVSAQTDVSLTATGAIARGTGTVLVSAKDLTLSGTSIGAAGTGNQIGTATDTLTAIASNGGIYVADDDAIALTNVAASGTANNVNVSNATGNITVGVVSGSAVTLNATNGGIVDDGVDTNVITATSLDLEAHDGIGAAGLHNEIDVNGGSLTAHAGDGGVYVTAGSSNLTLANVTAAGTNGDITIKDTAGNITVQTVSAPNTVTLDASGAIADDGANGTRIGANALVLTAGTSIGAIGANNELDTNVSTLDATATNGGVYVNELNGLTLNTVAANGAGHDVSVTSDSGNIRVASVTATNAVSLGATAGAIQDDADDTTKITGSVVALTAGTTIGASGGNNAMDIAGSSLFANAGNGGVYVNTAGNLTLTNVSAAGTNGDVTISDTAGDLTVQTVSAPGTVLLTASGAILDDNSNTTRIAANALALNAGTAIGVVGTNNEIDTNVSTLTATANNGGVYVGELNGLTVSSAVANGAGSNVSVSTDSGNIVVGSVSAANNVSLRAPFGAIVDDDNDATVISAANVVSLTAATTIGTVTDFSTAAGSSIDVQTNGSLLASVTSNTGEINLNLSGTPTINTGAIALGLGTGRSGSVLIQSQGNLNVAGLAPGAIDIGTGNTVKVGFVAGGVLTMPSSGGFTDAPPSALLVYGGSDVVDNDASPRDLSFSADTLNFHSGASGGATVLNTTVNRLDASVGNHDLTVNETDDVTVGTISTSFGNVTFTAGGAVSNDGDTSTRISGTAVTLAGSALGAAGAGNALDTQAFTLDATASAGGVYVRELDDLGLTAHATGGALDVQTVGGPLVVLGATGGAAGTILASGQGDLTLGAAIDGGTGPVNLTANNGNLNIASTVNTTGDATISAGGALVLAGSSHVAAHALTVSATAIGNPSQRLNTSVDSLNATARAGGLYVTEDDALALTATATGGAVDAMTTNGALTVASASGTGIQLIAGGDGNALTLNGAVSGGSGDVLLAATGAGSPINLNTTVTTTGNVLLDAGAASARGAINSNAGYVLADRLIAKGASIGADGAQLNTRVNSLAGLATNGAAYVQEDDALDVSMAATGSVRVMTLNGGLNVNSVSGNGVTLLAAGTGSDLTVTGSVSGGSGPVTLTAGRGMTLNGAVGTAGSVMLATAGAGSALTLNSIVAADNLSITAGPVGSSGAIVAGAGNQLYANDAILRGSEIGTAGARLNTSFSSLDALATNGGIFVSEADGLALNALTYTGAIDVRTANGALTVTSAASHDGVTLATGGDGNGITLNGGVNGGVQGGGGNVSITTSGAGADIVLKDAVYGQNISVQASGAGSNVMVNNALGTGSGAITVVAGGAITGSADSILAGGRVDLTGSAIGSSGTRLNTSALTLNVTSTNGGTFINHAGNATLTGSATGGALDVQSNGALTVASATGDGVSLATSAAAADITVNGAVNAGAGALTLAANGAGGGVTLNDALSTTGNATLTAGTVANRGLITTGSGGRVSAGSLTAAGSSIGSTTNRLSTSVGSLNATSTNGGIFVSESDALTLSASATGGALDVQTANGALTVNGASGKGVTLTAGGGGSGITLNGAIDAGSLDVALTAGTVASRGAIATGANNGVTAGTLTAAGSSIGSSFSALNTNIDTLNANASSGDVYVREQGNVKLADVRAGGKVDIASGGGSLTVNSITAAGDVSLAATSGAIIDDGDNSTRVAGKAVTLRGRVIGAPSTMTGTTLDSKARLDIDATSLDATSTAGGIFIDSLNGLASTSLHASGGTDGKIELLTANGDINLKSVSASDSLLLAAGRNIVGLPGLGAISARAAELRAGGADANEGHIGTLTQPLNLQLSAGNTLRLYVPQSVDPSDPARAPSTFPSAGVTSTLGLFGAPNPLAVQAGFGQFQSLSDTQFTSPAEALVRSIQNQTATVQSVLGLDWASFDPNVSLFGTIDPSVCLPGDQRDEEQGGAGC